MSAIDNLLKLIAVEDNAFYRQSKQIQNILPFDKLNILPAPLQPNFGVMNQFLALKMLQNYYTLYPVSQQLIQLQNSLKQNSSFALQAKMLDSSNTKTPLSQTNASDNASSTCEEVIKIEDDGNFQTNSDKQSILSSKSDDDKDLKEEESQDHTKVPSVELKIKKKRKRRPIESIVKNIKCPIKGCDKNYACIGSLKQHIKLKHMPHRHR